MSVWFAHRVEKKKKKNKEKKKKNKNMKDEEEEVEEKKKNRKVLFLSEALKKVNTGRKNKIQMNNSKKKNINAKKFHFVQV